MTWYGWIQKNLHVSQHDWARLGVGSWLGWMGYWWPGPLWARILWCASGPLLGVGIETVQYLWLDKREAMLDDRAVDVLGLSVSVIGFVPVLAPLWYAALWYARRKVGER